MVVKSIIIYPIKGMQGTSLASCNVLERGFENDRRYMLIDRNDNFVSQRSHPILALIRPQIIDDEIRILFKSNVVLSFPLSLSSGRVVEATLFENTVQGTLVSDEVSNQLSNLIDDEVRLIKMTNEITRNKKLIKGPASTEVSFADGYPYLIAGTASLNQLNQKMDHSVMMDRFRPNIVVETNVPHEEDEWESIQIGNAKLMIIKPCARCQVITINQQTAVKSKETLKVLSSYRKKDNKVFFGANAISLGDSHISVEDTVVAL